MNVCTCMNTQSGVCLSVWDTLGPANLSTVGSLIVHFSEVKCISTIHRRVYIRCLRKCPL